MKYILTTAKNIYEKCYGVKALRHKKGTKISMSEKYFNELKENGSVELILGFGEYISTTKYKLSDFESEVTVEKQINQKIKL
jgi:hypothetical protein